MEAQDIKNIAGVAYVQTLLRQLSDKLDGPKLYSEVRIDGMLGIDTATALDKIASHLFGINTCTAWDGYWIPTQGLQKLQTWYKYMYHMGGNRNPTLPEPEDDGRWGKDTKACFDAVFKAFEERTVVIATTRVSGEAVSCNYSVATGKDPEWDSECTDLLRSAIPLSVNTMASVEIMLPYNVIIFARHPGTNRPVGVLVANKAVGSCSVSKLTQNELRITGLHVEPNIFSWEEVAEGMVKELLKVARLGAVAEMFHSQSLQRSPRSEKVEELLINKFSFYKDDKGHVKRRG